MASIACGDGPKVGVFSVRVNGGAVNTIQCIGAPGADASSMQFQGAWADPSGSCQASWDYSVDLDPTGNAKIVGAATVVNNGSEKADFDLAFEVPICPHISSGAKMGGSCTLKLTTSANGGALTTAPGDAIFAGLVDGNNGPKLFHGPFNMGSTGSGTAQTMNAFGAPFPGHNVNAVMDDFGVHHVFGLTDGESVIITSNVILGGEQENFVECPEASGGDQMPEEAQASGGEPAEPGSPGAPSSSSVVVGEDASDKVTLKASKSSKSSKSSSKGARKPSTSRSSASKKSSSSGARR